ncbi:MAG: YihY/virulence factor BrkB family protein [Clostridiales bacterium]|nr:YihY/virulence factor BrkB family protein [Clostridiales bacterium]
MDTRTIVNLVITGLIALFILSGMFWGLKRGLKKTAIRSVWLLVTAGLLMLFLSSVVTNAIINMSFNFTYAGVEVHNLSELITVFLEESGTDLAMLGDSVGVVIESIIKYVALILNAFMFVILFWVLKIILLPVNWALSKWVFLSKKEKQYRADLKEYKRYKKATKHMPKMEVMAFASGADSDPLEEEVSEINEGKKKKGFASLTKARNAYDDELIRSKQVHTSVATMEEDRDTSLDRPYQEKKVEKEEKVEEVEYQPKEEHKPKSDKKDKVNLSEFRVTTKPKKLKKHRFWGMVLGGVMGIFVASITVSPLVGILSIADNINANNEITLEDGTKQGMIDYVSEGMFGEINGYYKDAIGTNILTYSGGKWVANTTFDLLTRGKIDGVSADLTSDVNAIVKVVNEVNNLTDYWKALEENNYDQMSMDKVVSGVDRLVDCVFDISIISILAPSMINIVADVLEKEVVNSVAIKAQSDDAISDDRMQDILQTMVEALRKIDSAETLEKEIKSLINILKTLNYGVSIDMDGDTITTSLLCEIVKGVQEEESDMIRTIQKLNYTYYKTNNKMYFSSLVDKFYKYEDYEPIISNSILPECINVFLELILREMGVGDASSIIVDMTDDEIKTFVVSTIDNIFMIMFELNTTVDSSGNLVYSEYTEDNIDNIKLAEINRTVFSLAGKILDGVVQLVGPESYTEIIDEVSNDFAKSMEEALVGVISEEDATTLSGNLANALKQVGGEKTFESEFTELSDAFEYLFLGKEVTNEDGQKTYIKPLISSAEGEFTFGNIDTATDDILSSIEIGGVGRVLNAMQDMSIFAYKAEDEKENNIVFLIKAILEKQKNDIKVKLDEADTTTLDTKGYILNTGEVDGLLYNMLNGIQNNIDSGLTQVGAYDWEAGIGNTTLYSAVMQDISDNADYLTNFDIDREGKNIIDILIDNSEGVSLILSDNSYKNVTWSLLDYINDYPIFKNVLDRLFTDLKSVVKNVLDSEESSMGDEIEKVIDSAMNSLKNTAKLKDNENVEDNFYNQLCVVRNTINAFNEFTDEHGSENIELNSGTIGGLGAVLDTLTKPVGSSRLLTDADVNDVICCLFDDVVLDGEDGVLADITDNNIKEPMQRLLIQVRDKFDNTKDRKTLLSETVTADVNKGKWEKIMTALGGLLDHSFDNMNSVESALDNAGELLDTLSGRNEDNIVFASDSQIKELLIGVVANNVGGNAGMTDKVKKVLFSVDGNNKTALISKFDNLIYVPSDIDASEKEQYKYFANNNKANNKLKGILQSLYDLDTNKTIEVGAGQDPITFSWTYVCSDFKSLVDLEEISMGRLDNTDGRYTFYGEEPKNESGTGLILDELIDSTYPILTHQQVKYLIKDVLTNSEDINIKEDGYSKGLTDKIVENIDKANASISYDQEFRTIQYLIDISGSLNVETADWGVYLDEISESQLLSGIGEVVVNNALDDVVEKSEDITDQKIGQPVTRLLEDVQDNFANVVADKDNNWTKIMGAFDSISKIDFASMSDIDVALESVSSMLDILTGRPFKIKPTDANTVEVQFVADTSAKEFLISVVANNVGGNNAITQDTKNVIFNVYTTANKDELLDELNSLVYNSATNDYFTDYQITEANTTTGVLQNIYNLNNSVKAFMWSDICDNLKGIVNIKEISLGSHGHVEVVGGITYTYTYYGKKYGTEKVAVSGIGATLDDIITMDNSVFTLEHVKYLIKKQITVDSKKYYITQVLTAMRDNVEKLEEGTLDKECKDLQYFIDFVDGGEDFDDCGDYGAYFDELNSSALLGGVGKVMLESAVDTILDADKDTIVDAVNQKKEFDDLRAQIDEINTKINAFKPADDTNEYKFFNSVKNNIDSIYSRETKPNSVAFSAINDINNVVKTMDYTGKIDISTKDEFNKSAAKALENIIYLNGWLYTLQSNALLGVIEARYIAITIVDQLVKSISFEVEFGENKVQYNYEGSDDNHYDNKIDENNVGYKEYLQSRMLKTDEECYADNEKGETKNSTKTYAYILNKVFDDIVGCITTKLGYNEQN